MKIIDGAQDYYDFAGMGIDPSVVYDRRDIHGRQIDDACGLPDGIYLRASFLNAIGVWIQPFYALVGGFGVPGLRILTVRQEMEDIFTHLYDIADARQTIAKALDQHYRRANERAEEMMDTWNRHFDRGMQDLTALCIDHRIVTGQLVRNIAPRLTRHNDDPPGTAYEPVRLVEIGVQDVLPAHEAHMLVSRFVGGILPTGPVTAEISDRSKILKAGFDLKQSFRTRKSA